MAGVALLLGFVVIKLLWIALAIERAGEIIVRAIREGNDARAR